MMPNPIDRVAIVIAIIGLANQIARADTSTDQVATQFRAFCLQESTDHGQRLLDDVELPTASSSQLDKILSSQKEDGSWADLDYASKARSSWPPSDHLTRMLTITVHARQSGTDAGESKRCIAAVHRALGFWIIHDFKCPNWWFNDIGGPKILGTVALLLGDDLEPAELTYITSVAMARSKVGSITGQNRVWLAGNGVMRAVLTHDGNLLKKAADVIADEIKVADQEGIQPDWSFHQHGPQQQFGNYGMAFAVEMAKWASVLRGTPYAFSDEKLAIIRNYMLEGQNWITWHGVLDISACGRQLFPGSPEKKAGSIRGVFKSMETVDPEKAADYQAFAGRNTGDHPNDLIGDKFFWRSDYLIHRQPDWMVSLKMSSSRVIGSETVNSENLSGLHLADGATFIYRTGHEYDDIFPVWDWRKIPGTTAVQDKSPLNWSGKNARIMTAFTGGASDGKSSCAAMDLQRGPLKAKKAWFFCGGTVVCMGADISCSTKDPVVSTIDQCLLWGESPPQPREKADSITHAGTRYELLSPGTMNVNAERRTGNWASVFQSPATPRADVTAKVLTITIDHGAHPAGAAYAYAITPDDDASDAHILANTALVQAAQIGPHWSAAVFWSPGGISLDGIAIRLDSPCIVLKDNGKFWISDPTQLLKSIQFTFDGRSQTIALPRDGDAGKSVQIQMWDTTDK